MTGPIHRHLNVTDSPYNADPTGQTDATSAFNKALSDAALKGGIVLAPSGVYRIGGDLEVPPYVTLEGVFAGPQAWTHDHKRGTLLLAYGTRKPLITLLGHNSTLKGLTIYYPDQSDVEHPRDYPPTVRGGISPSSAHDNITIQDVLMVNPWFAVDFEQNQCGRHLIQRLYGQPIKVGIAVDQCFDVGRIEDVHFWPFWTKNHPSTGYIAKNGFALVLKTTDWQIVHNFFAYGYHVGVHMHKGDHLGAKGPNGQFTNLNLDQVGIGLDIYSIQQPGVFISNCNIVGGSLAGQNFRRAIWCHAGEILGPLAIVNGSFWGNFSNDRPVEWEASPSLLQISSSFLRTSSGILQSYRHSQV